MVDLVKAGDQFKAGRNVQVIVIEKKVSSSKFWNVVVLGEAGGLTSHVKQSDVSAPTIHKRR